MQGGPDYRDEAVALRRLFTTPAPPITYLFCLELMDAERPFEFFDRIEHRARVCGSSSTITPPVVVGDTLTFQSRVTGDVTPTKFAAR
jgi:hypothetical protein